MSTQHTPGRVEHDMRGYPHADVRSVSGRKIAGTWGMGHQKTAEAYKRRTEQDRANARRIVACWNACDGIADPENAFPRLMAAETELLAALKVCEGNISSLLASAHPQVFGEWLSVVRAAIDKAVGLEALDK